MAGDSTRSEVSVILCTYNPRSDLLRWTLDSIAKQTFDKSRFELLVVDNNSSPPLQAEDLNPDGAMPLRLISEPRQGLTYGRVAGIRASTAELLVFVDDDNYLDPDYLSKAVAIADSEPTVGIYGGISVATFNRPIPKWKYGLLSHLGVRNYGGEPITSFEDCWGKWEPIGAGMVARRDVAEQFVAFVEKHEGAAGLGRKGTTLMSGEDTLFARCANKLGYSCSYQPSLRLEHCLETHRLRTAYLRRLLEGHGRSFVRLEQLQDRPVKPVRGITALIFLLARLFHRVASKGRTGYVLWWWDVGYVRESRNSQ